MEAPSKSLDELESTLRDLVAWLRHDSTPGIIIGGVAASILGRSRATRDVDALVLLPEEHWPSFMETGKSFGFTPRISDPLAFAVQSRVLLLVHVPTQTPLDISLGLLPFEEEAIARSRIVSLFGIELPLPTPEDLIIMKAVALRSRDLSDIESVLDANPTLDVARIRHWVSAFADIVETPELVSAIDNLLKAKAEKERRRKGRKK